MEKLFCLGLALGMVGGALIVANSYKARSLVKKSQAELMQKMDELMDEKLQKEPKAQEEHAASFCISRLFPKKRLLFMRNVL